MAGVPRGPSGEILIVDDEESIRRSLADGLRADDRVLRRVEHDGVVLERHNVRGVIDQFAKFIDRGVTTLWRQTSMNPTSGMTRQTQWYHNTDRGD